MVISILILGIVAAIWAFAYFRTPFYIWTGSAFIGLILFSLLTPFVGLAVTLWLIFSAIFVVLAVPRLRRRLISNPVLKKIKSVLPSMSQTEKDALEAGTVWWDGELFSGKPNWSKLSDLPKPALTEDEQAFLDGPVEQLCAMLDDWQITHQSADLPPKVWQFIKDNGFFGMIIPKEYGGLGFSALAHSQVVMKISSRSTSASVTVMVPNSLGPAELLLRYGTDAQKNYYLPRLAKGEEIPCFALTGPEAGSDAGAMPDTGIVCRGDFQDKKDVLGIRLNWEKRYITLGPVATVLGLAFKLYDPDHLLGGKPELGITLALIPTDTPGVSIGRRHFPLNSAFQNGPNWGKDVFIPLDWIIGGVERAGQGWRMLMECLAAGRSISLPALSTGGGKLACRATGAYARIRKQFKTPIGRFEGIEEALARMAAYTYQIDAARVVTAAALDCGEHPSVISAIIKYHATEKMRKIINDAMDIQGGAGICMGPNNLLGRVYQAIPISITVEGANILTRSMIIFGQGAIRCHPYIFKEMQAATDPDAEQASTRFDQAFFAHLGFTFSNALRALFLGLTNARWVSTPRIQARRYYQHITRLSAAFAFTADIAMLVLGGALKRKETLSGRLADVLSQLYLASTSLQYWQNQGEHATDFPLLKWACEDALYSAQESLLALIRNFPSRPIAWLLRMTTFPLGKSFAPPDDKTTHKVASLLLDPSDIRDRLTAGIYVPDALSEKLAILEDALQKTIAAEPLESKLSAAVRSGEVKSRDYTSQIEEALSEAIIDQQEATILKNAHTARRSAIEVNDFDAKDLIHPVWNELEN
jgi:acyl-CoA dehydrogenase